MSEELIPPDFLLSQENFEKCFVNRENYAGIRQLALDGHLGSLQNRFTCWRIFLGILPETFSMDQWVQRLNQLRSEHRELLKSHRSVKTDHLDPLIFNPLSSATENPWNNFHVDNELKENIRKDVGRTFQERPLFLVGEVQELMVSVLFTWAKEHPEISYKQGMNELLGIILFVAYAEKAPEDLRLSFKAAEYLSVLNNPREIEADIYWCFTRLMDLGITELFNPVVVHKQQSKKADLFTWDTDKSRNDLVNQDKSTADGVSSVLKRCHKIHHRILQNIDKELYLYLEKQKIEPQMYLQRYLRCILSREFNLADTLIIWDSLFASLSHNSDFKAENQGNLCKELNLLDFVCVAMIIFVRATGKIYVVLQSDYSGILRRLLKFPPVEDVHILISMALSYQDKMQGKSVSKPQINTFTAKSASPLNSSPTLKGPLEKSPDEIVEKAPEPKKEVVFDPLTLKVTEKLVEKPREKTTDIGKSIETTRILLKTEENKKEEIKKEESRAEEVKKEEVKKEEVKRIEVRKENVLVEKCNTALLLLLEQSDEQVYNEDKMTRALQVLQSLKEDITKEMQKKNSDPLRKF